MLSVSEVWQNLWSDALHKTEILANIDGVVYENTDIISCSVHRSLFETLNIGNAVSSELNITFRPKTDVPKQAKIEVYVRLTDESGVNTSEWIPQGVFYTDTRSKEYDGVLKLVAYDAMLMCDQPWFSDGVVSGDWPKKASDVVSEVLQRIGITMDSRTELNDLVMVSVPINYTIREVLGYIAAAHGGNFAVTPLNQLRLITIETLPSTAYLGDENGNILCDEKGNLISVLDGSAPEFISMGLSTQGDIVEISKVILNADDEYSYVSGDDSGYSIEATCPFASQDIADFALSVLDGVKYAPVQATGLVLNPALELGDSLLCGGRFFGAYTETIQYTPAAVADVGSPIDGDVEHEYPYLSKEEKEIDRKIAQTKAEIKLTTDSITSTVEGLEDDVSEISQTVSTITLAVTNGEESSVISILVNGIVVASKTIRFTGDVVFGSDLTDGKTIISADNLLTGIIQAELLKLTQALEVYKNASSDMSGFLGYIAGRDANGNKTTGVGIMDASEVHQVVATSGGARMNSDTAEVVCATNVTLQAPSNAVNVYANKFTSDVDLTVSSDRNLKDDIRYDITEKYLRIFDSLQPASFLYKGKTPVRHLGFIAQDVEESMNSAGVERADFAVLNINEDGKYGLNYSEFIPMLVAKIQQQENRIAELEAKLSG